MEGPSKVTKIAEITNSTEFTKTAKFTRIRCHPSRRAHDRVILLMQTALQLKTLVTVCRTKK